MGQESGCDGCDGEGLHQVDLASRAEMAHMSTPGVHEMQFPSALAMMAGADRNGST